MFSLVKMNKVLVGRLVLLVLLYVFHCSTRPVDRSALERRLCGRRLSQVLTHLCKYNFYAPDASSDRFPEQVKANQRKRGGEVNNVVLGRVSRGLTHDCCINPCSRAELVKYCGSNEKNSASPSSPTTTWKDSQARGRAYLVPILLRLWGDRSNGKAGGLAFRRRNGKKTRDVHQLRSVQREKSGAPDSDETLRDKLDNLAYETVELEDKLASTMEFVTEPPLPDLVALPDGTNDKSYLN